MRKGVVFTPRLIQLMSKNKKFSIGTVARPRLFAYIVEYSNERTRKKDKK